MARAEASGDKALRQREQRLAVMLAKSCRESPARRQVAVSKGGLAASAVPLLLFLLGLLALAGVLKEYFA